jgi:7-cyano-7-deazaguanine synthase
MMSDRTKPAIVLISGGLDSATVAAIAKERGFAIHALTFQYGQRHAIEINAARKVASAIGAVRHVVQTIDLRAFGGSALTDNIAVPKADSVEAIQGGIPITYVPARNTIFLSFALAFAEVVGACDIFIGVSAVDYSGYPDCRPEFIEAFQTLATLATKAGADGNQMRIHAPLVSIGKAETIRNGIRLGVDYAITHSCYDPNTNGAACGACDSCLLRRRGFADAGQSDPVVYPPIPEN